MTLIPWTLLTYSCACSDPNYMPGGDSEISDFRLPCMCVAIMGTYPHKPGGPHWQQLVALCSGPF